MHIDEREKQGQEEFPFYVNKPLRLLWADMDEVILSLAVGFAALTFRTWYLFFLALVLPFGLRKIKKKYPRGVLGHFLYIIGLSRIGKYPGRFYDKFQA